MKFQTLTIKSNIIHSLKYQRFKPSGYKDKRFRKLEFKERNDKWKIISTQNIFSSLFYIQKPESKNWAHLPVLHYSINVNKTQYLIQKHNICEVINTKTQYLRSF